MYIVLAVLLVIIVVIIAKTTYDADDYLYGFWAAEGDRFCEESGIGSMLLFIGDGSRGWFNHTRQCYIVITNGFSNQGMTLQYRYALGTPLSSMWATTAAVTFDDEQIWPEHVNVVVDRAAGTLTISADDVVYARLTKHNEISLAAKCAGDAE